MTASVPLRSSPKGFAPESWADFRRDGILVIDNALQADALSSVQALIDEIRNVAGQSSTDGGLRLQNVVEFHPLLAALIAKPAYIGYLYDLYGDSLKLLASELFVRPCIESKASLNTWHFDGPRLAPFDVFSPQLPLRVKVDI